MRQKIVPGRTAKIRNSNRALRVARTGIQEVGEDMTAVDCPAPCWSPPMAPPAAITAVRPKSPRRLIFTS